MKTSRTKNQCRGRSGGIGNGLSARDFSQNEISIHKAFRSTNQIRLVSMSERYSARQMTDNHHAMAADWCQLTWLLPWLKGFFKPSHYRRHGMAGNELYKYRRAQRCMDIYLATDISYFLLWRERFFPTQLAGNVFKSIR